MCTGVMQTELNSRNDIETLINSFYEKVKKDEVIGYFFTDVVAVDWEKHLPVMYDFWESNVFGSGNYHGNPMAQHIRLSRKSPMEKKHFDRWLELFTSTVDELFTGLNAELIKQRALSIATVMQIKIHNRIR